MCISISFGRHFAYPASYAAFTAIISGAKQHFWDNLDMKPDRATLNLEAAQEIIDSHRLTLYQTDRETLKFLADNGYVLPVSYTHLDVYKRQVLIYWRNTSQKAEHFEITHYEGDHWFLLDNTGRPWIEVVAWMPLPEPPKENQQHE